MTDQITVKRWIRPLPERVINKIAAGEVIDRPAAVVKELVENSIDAGSDRIEILVEKSGTQLIKIVDNGCGIPEEQVEVAFGRHATSKISGFDDLDNLQTYGFRGEALPSVASVSRLRMVTRPSGQAAGTEIVYDGGVLQFRRPTASAPGTTIEVQNLFHNTPARRKFLKAESTEARHISRNASALAIGRPDIGFVFTINERELFRCPSGSTLARRIADVIGSAVTWIEIDGEAGPVRITGLVGTPESAQRSRHGQYLFINQRFIASATLSHALSAGYGEMLPSGRHPVGAIMISVDPGEVDVNVHPTKAEVRLSREREVHDAVYHLVKHALRTDGVIPRFRAAQPPLAPTGHGGASFTVIRPSGEPVRQEHFAELYRPPQVQGPALGMAQIAQVNLNTGEVIPPEPDARAAEESDSYRLVGRFSDLYLIFQREDRLYIVDQHTAHERVLYEQTLRRLQDRALDSQSLLFPEQIELNPQQYAVYDEIGSELNRSGFLIEPFGGRMVLVSAMPALMSRRSAAHLLTRIIDDIASLRKAGFDLTKAMAQSIACRSAVMAGDRLGDREAVHLIAQLLTCDNKYTCPHGRPTFIEITREQLDKQFGRA